MKRITKPPFSTVVRLFCGLILILLLVACGGNEEELKEIELLREEVARLVADNGLTDGKGEETDGNASWENPSFAPLPLKWQSKGGVAEATEDLRALHLATQRYLDANDDFWPQAPRSVRSQFWEAELKPFGATAEHWRHSEHPLKDKQPYYSPSFIGAEKGAPYENENQRWFGTRSDPGELGIHMDISSIGQLVDLAADHSFKLPVDPPIQTLNQSTGNLAKIDIRQNGVYFVMGKQFTVEQVLQWLKAEFDNAPALKVLIRCDQDTKHLYLANVLSICRQVGVPKANIAIKTER